MEPRAIDVKPMRDYLLEVTFEGGEKGFFDVKPYIKGDWFSELRDVRVFNAVKVDGLSVSWPNGQDIAPDCLYRNAVRRLSDASLDRMIGREEIV